MRPARCDRFLESGSEKLNEGTYVVRHIWVRRYKLEVVQIACNQRITQSRSDLGEKVRMLIDYIIRAIDNVVRCPMARVKNSSPDP